MAQITQPDFLLFDDPIKYYNAMLDDILNAGKLIYIETYKFGTHTIGIKFRDALTRKAKEGLEVKVLIDSWGGSSIPDDFFKDLIKFGGEVRYFEKIKINFDLFTRSHRRNHRKVLVIDDQISYMGSSNITEYNLIWRESMLRMTGPITLDFKKVFVQDFKIYNKYIRYKRSLTQTIRYKDSEIIRDVPSVTRQRIKKRYERLIRSAIREIVIESPYFLPGFILRKDLIAAANRGVEVKVIIPKISDVRMVNILHGRYLEMLHNHNIKFLYFIPHNLHAKILLIDNKIFSIGSPNFDYRSFRYMHEIALVGTNPEIIRMVKDHINETMKYCEPFDYETWKRRPAIQKFFEWLLLPLRHLL
nr:phosphatidylserine/phosphatidylglycerophosphate/cardiolipin synthase family protein [Bacteroidota bacterium]